MKKYFYILIAIVMAGSLSAAEPVEETTRTPLISFQKGDKPESYILFTTHTKPLAEYSPHILPLFNKCPTFVTEHETKNLYQLETLRDIGALKQNKEDWLSKTEGLEQQNLGALNTQFKEIYGLGLESIEPWAAYGVLGLMRLPSQEEGIDATLLAQANQASKKIFYFEPFELYIDVATKGRLLNWDDILPLYSAPATSIDESKLFSAFGYNFSNYEKYILEADQHLHPQDFIVRRRDERNEVWFPNLEKYYQEAAPFFGDVGSEHAVGRKGIVNYLLQENYIVKQMDSDGNFQVLSPWW